MGKILIMDPSLEGEMSHQHYAVSALIHELRCAALQVDVIGHVDATEAVKALPAKTLFRLSGYHHKPGSGRGLEMETLALANAVLLSDLLGLNKEMFGRDDFVFFPAINASMVLAVCQWISSFEAARAPRFGMCLMFQMNWKAAGGVSNAGEVFYRQAFPFVPPPLRQRCVFTCETEGLAQEYEPLLGERPSVLPIPTLQHLVNPEARSADSSSPVIAFLGYARPEKGFELLPDVVAEVGRQVPDARFVIQLMGHDEELIARVRSRLDDFADVVTLVEGTIQPAKMVGLLEQASLVLLPYNNCTYRTRGSAIFTEARTVGVPMVLPAATAIGNEGDGKGLAVTFAVADAAEVAAATIDALHRLEELSQNARIEALSVRDTWPGYMRPLLEESGLLAPRVLPSARVACATTVEFAT